MRNQNSDLYKDFSNVINLVDESKRIVLSGTMADRKAKLIMELGESSVSYGRKKIRKKAH